MYSLDGECLERDGGVQVLGVNEVCGVTGQAGSDEYQGIQRPSHAWRVSESGIKLCEGRRLGGDRDGQWCLGVDRGWAVPPSRTAASQPGGHLLPRYRRSPIH